MTARTHRGTLFEESAEVLSHEHMAADQHILRLRAPRVAAHAEPGSFVHLRCHRDLPLRRPFSIMRAEADTGAVDLLYKVVGRGGARLAECQPGEHLDLLGPVGRGFVTNPERTRPLLLGGGVGIPPMIFLAERLALQHNAFRPVVMMGSEVPFPLPIRAARIRLHGAPRDATASLALLEDRGLACRLASQAGLEGCHHGFVTDLARAWLSTLAPEELASVEVFACGPTPMLGAAARLAEEFGLPGQVCLEEFMACAVGGCAGCAVRVHTVAEVAMKRVCVDGPVFDARSVFPPRLEPEPAAPR